MNHKLTTIVHAQGFIEAQIESMHDDAQKTPDNVAGVQLAQQVLNMWLVVSGGLDMLRRQNAEMEAKLNSIRVTVNS